MPSSRHTLAAVLCAALLAGCVTSTTITYLPSPEQPRVSLAEGRQMLARFVGVECDRLREAGRAGGDADLLVRTDSAGLATEAELARGSGDSRVDGVMGAVAAQLRLDGSSGALVALRAGYSCGGDGAIATSLELR